MAKRKSDKSKKENLDKITFQLPTILKRQFKARLDLQGKGFRDVLEPYVRQYLKEHG